MPNMKTVTRKKATDEDAIATLAAGDADPPWSPPSFPEESITRVSPLGRRNCADITFGANDWSAVVSWRLFPMVA